MNRKRALLASTTAGMVAFLAVSGCTQPLDDQGAAASSPAAQSGEAEQSIGRVSEETCQNSSPTDTPISEMVIGFSQSENEQNPFRAVETQSVRAAVEEAGAQFVYTNANNDQAKQVSDIQSLINQGVDALIVAPISATGLQAAFSAAKNAGIPVVTIDRQTEGTPCEDFLTFMGSDFREQGERAAEALVEALGGEGQVAEVQGLPGTDVATLRTEGFGAVAEDAGLEIVAQQPANWATSEAQRVVEQVLSSQPDVRAIYTHSDTMALGALTAVQNAGKAPGEDVVIVSIDGTRDAVQHVAEGRIHAVVETNPRFGPGAVSVLEDWFAGEPVPQEMIMEDSLYTEDNAQEAIDSGAAY
jgi:ribose transport system substrate-binding protein